MIRIFVDADGKLHLGAVGSSPDDPWTTAQWQEVQLRFLNADGQPYLHAVGATVVIALKESKAATALLASATGFTRPADATGWYTGDLSLITDQLDSLGDNAHVYLEVRWTISSKPYRSDPLKILTQKPLTTDEDAVPTDGTAAARAAWLAQYIQAGDGVTITPNTTTGKIVIEAEGGNAAAPTFSGGFLSFIAANGQTYRVPGILVP